MQYDLCNYGGIKTINCHVVPHTINATTSSSSSLPVDLDWIETNRIGQVDITASMLKKDMWADQAAATKSRVGWQAD